MNAAQLVHIVPGQRVPNEMSPLIAMRNGKPVLAIATLGSSLIPETMGLLVGILARQRRRFGRRDGGSAAPPQY